MTWNVAGLDPVVQKTLDISPTLSESFSNFKEEIGLPAICIFGFQEIDTRNEAYLYLDPTRNQ